MHWRSKCLAQEGIELLAACWSSIVPSGHRRGICVFPELPVVYLDAPAATAGEVWQLQEYLVRVPTPQQPTRGSLVPTITRTDSLERRLRVLVTGPNECPGASLDPACHPGAVAALCMLPLGLVYCGTAEQSATNVLARGRGAAARVDPRASTPLQALARSNFTAGTAETARRGRENRAQAGLGPGAGGLHDNSERLTNGFLGRRKDSALDPVVSRDWP